LLATLLEASKLGSSLALWVSAHDLREVPARPLGIVLVATGRSVYGRSQIFGQAHGKDLAGLFRERSTSWSSHKSDGSTGSGKQARTKALEQG
jgi:hypothetical protein